MTSPRPDVLFINPGGRAEGYQALGRELAAIEPPIWIGLLAENARRAGLRVEVLDADAEGLSIQAVAERVRQADPHLACTIVFGANPSASTQKMDVVAALAAAVRESAPAVRHLIGGLHPSALPEQTLRETGADFVSQGEGPHTIVPLARRLREGGSDWSGIAGLWWLDDGRAVSNPPAPLLTNLDDELPGAAWDLIPPTAYRAHNWHCFDRIDDRSPYAVLYTSLGCPFRCHFCCINALFGRSGIRYRGIDQAVAEIDLLVRQYGVRNIKILDELFVLNRKRVERFCDLLIPRGYDLNLWAYARVDTVDRDLLARLRQAGVRWLAYGFESASPRVRDDVEKGYRPEQVAQAVGWTREAGIHIIANYILGLPEDDLVTMQQTLDEAVAYNFEYLNLYCAMAYPGSRLYESAVAQSLPLPQRWSGYSQLGPDTLPLPTRYLSGAEVLRFRDRAFNEYHSRPEYLSMIESTFGPPAAQHVCQMLQKEIVRLHA